MINDRVDPFITQYRDALERQRDLSNQNLDNIRRNDFSQIMGAANRAGMMYSNFPQRSKIQYDTQNYMPSQAKIQSTYQTGLGKLRENMLSISNQLKSINEAIADLNATGVNGSGGGNTGTKTKKITIDGVTYNVVGSPRTNDGGGIEYDLDDGKGVLLIDPNSVKQVN